MQRDDRPSQRKKIEWKDSYSVGVEQLDVQHQTLLELINSLRGLVDLQKTSGTDCFAALNSMIRYAQSHFTTELGYLGKYKYPEYDQQKKEHDDFVEKAFSMSQQLEDGRLTLKEIANFLEDWYADHILGTDQRYRAFLARKMEESAES